MTRFPWFKFYTEFIHDPKMRRFNDADHGVWAKILCLASESPIRGKLLITKREPMTVKDIKNSIYTDYSDEELLALFKIWRHLGMMGFYENDGQITGAIEIINFVKRQGSDVPEAINERVRKFRLNKAKNSMKQKGNGNVTDLKRGRNAQEEEGEEDKEGDKKGRELRVSDETPALTPKQITVKFFKQVDDLINGKTEDAKELQEYLRSMVAKGAPKEVLWQHIQEFYLYWTEKNKSGTKQRWEMQETFEVNRRLGTWFRRIKEFKKTTFVRPQYHPDDVAVK